jgi:hypothetical protein
MINSIKVKTTKNPDLSFLDIELDNGLVLLGVKALKKNGDYMIFVPGIPTGEKNEKGYPVEKPIFNINKACIDQIKVFLGNQSQEKDPWGAR